MESKHGNRRKSLFTLSNLRPSSLEDSSSSRKTLTKKTAKHRSRSPSLSPLTTIDDHPDVPQARPLSGQPATSKPRRPELSIKGMKRPPSVFESFKNSVRQSSDEVMVNGGGGYSGEPLSSTSSKASSVTFDQAIDGTSPSMRAVLLHGEVQTSAGMFRKKKEYLVLTEAYMIRYKSQVKAAETFKSIPVPAGTRNPPVRHGSGHGSMASIGSQSELQTLSDSSGDKHGRVPLRQVVAVHKLDDGKPYFALEICYLDEESGQASAMTLQFNNPEERDGWLRRIRDAVNDARLRESTYITSFNLENAARVVERENDYDPANCAIFKVVQRQVAAKSGSRSSAEDLSKVASTVCFLVIGVHKLHLVQLVKPVARTSTPSLANNPSQTSHGILTLAAAKVSSFDDTFELTFRQPLQKPKVLYLASSASYDIAARLHFASNYLRPECAQRLFKWTVPPEVEELLPPHAASDMEEHSCLDRTLIAYCVAYGINPATVRYTVNYTCEDGPGFELLAPADLRRPNYGPLELLAIMRALRYNESFGSISFANVQLDCLNGLHDNYGHEHVCSRTKRGTAIKLTAEELSSSSLLVQEIRALAATNKKLRRLDFSGCVTTKHTSSDDQAEPSRTKDIGCGIVEALFPLCKHQTTNVDWICLNGIELSETDQDYLVGAAVDKLCHFRAIELNRCGLNDRSMGLILDALRAQENTLEALELAGNACRLNPSAFDSQLGMFGFIRKLNLANVSRTSGAESFLEAETLLIWRLQELRLSGTALNSATIDAISTYLAHPQSDSLRELYVDHTYLSGSDIATLMHSLSAGRTVARNMHLDIGQCLLNKGLEQVTQAISSGFTPTHLSMKAIEYREESMFRKVITALTGNKTIRFLDMSQTALPGDASEETCKALSRLLAENDTIVELDISGDDSRLATSKFGPGLNEALNGLKQNSTLQVFRIEKQKLGVRGASTLAEVLRVNRTLLELHCDNNDIPLQGLTTLVNALIDNTSLVVLPPMNDGREAAFKAAESTMKVMSDLDHSTGSANTKPSHHHQYAWHGASAMKRGLANVRKGASRSANSNMPSFPALSSYSRSSTSSDAGATPQISLTLPQSKTKHNAATSIAGPPSHFTVQDIQTTHRLLTEQWDRQCYRLEQYLNRNWCILNNIPCEMEIEDEAFERPASVGSIGKMLEQVKYDTTPKAERSAYFDSSLEMPEMPSTAGSEDEKQQDVHNISFKQFILESGPDEDDDIDLHDDDVVEDVGKGRQDEPRTPTQKAFQLD